MVKYVAGVISCPFPFFLEDEFSIPGVSFSKPFVLKSGMDNAVDAISVGGKLIISAAPVRNPGKAKKTPIFVFPLTFCKLPDDNFCYFS